jgi:hypothetical protein
MLYLFASSRRVPAAVGVSAKIGTGAGLTTRI